jgi:hypothetical protein
MADLRDVNLIVIIYGIGQTVIKILNGNMF